MKFENTIIDERFILAAIHGARLSYGNGKNSDSELFDGMLCMGVEDTRFLQARLGAAVSGENKFLRTIPVSVVISAPMKFWTELDTYKIGTTRQSSSLMHRLASKGHFTIGDFDVLDKSDSTFLAMLASLNHGYDKWLETGSMRHDKNPVWTQWQDMIPRSYIYTSHWTANYAVLRGIYFQRRNHRMRQWQAFVEWINSLPHSWLITFEKPEKVILDK